MSGFFDLTNIPAPDLDKLLCSFFKDLRKKDGSDYEPDTVSSLQRSTERHITEQKLLFDILKDDAFSRSRSVLATKRKSLVKEGRGNKLNAVRELTDEEEAKLFETGEFGNHNPLALQRTLWWFLSMQFGFRARDESRKLCWGDIVLDVDAETGREVLVWTAEREAKRAKVLKTVINVNAVLKRLPPVQKDALFFITSRLRPAVRRKLTAQNCHSMWQLITKPGAKTKFSTRAHHSARTKSDNLCPRRQKMPV